MKYLLLSFLFAFYNMHPVQLRVIQEGDTEPAITAEEECRQFNGILYQKQCFFALDTRYNFAEAIYACPLRHIHAMLAPITSVETYNVVVPFLRQIAVAKGVTAINWRTGMVYDPENKNGDFHAITTLDGATITFSSGWFPGYPYTTTASAGNANRITMNLLVNADESNASQGIWNGPQSDAYRAVCVISV